MSDYPKRHPNHSLEQKSEAFFRSHVPEDWNINGVDKDYGQDLNLEIAEGGEYRGLDLIVQLKASKESSVVEGSETHSINVSTFNYLDKNVRVVLFVKYIEAEKEAYWLLLKDVPPPNEKQKTFTLYFPRENKLSTLDWSLISDYVRTVTDIKQAARKAAMKKPS
jgi:hypothetical protein